MAISQTGTEHTPRLVDQVATLFPEQGQWDEEDYFALPDSNHFVELSEREIIMPPPPDFSHQSAAMHLVSALDRFNEKHDRGILRFAPSPFASGTARFANPILSSF